METIKSYAKHIAGAVSGVAMFVATVAFAQTPTPLETLFTDSLDTIETSYVTALTTNIPLLIAAVVPIAVTMYFLYKGWSWIRRAAR